MSDSWNIGASTYCNSASTRCINDPVNRRRESDDNLHSCGTEPVDTQMRVSRHVLVYHLVKESLGDGPVGRWHQLSHSHIMNQIFISKIVSVPGTPIHHATRCVPLVERRKAATARVEVKFKLPSQGDATERSYAAEVICVRSTILGRGLD